MAAAALDLLLAQVKKGNLKAYKTLLDEPALTIEVLNAVPPGRSNAAIHHLAYWGKVEALQAALVRFPSLDLSVLNKKGQNALHIALEYQRKEFFDFLAERMNIASVSAAEAPFLELSYEVLNAAHEERWSEFRRLLSAEEKKIDVNLLNTVPLGKQWGAIHHIAHWGNIKELKFLVDTFAELDLDLRTLEPKPQTAVEVARGRGHTEFVNVIMSFQLRLCVLCSKQFTGLPKGFSCSVEHHFICIPCFENYIEEQYDPASPIAKGILACPKEGCKSPQFANKDIAHVLSDASFNKYLQAREIFRSRGVVEEGTAVEISREDVPASAGDVPEAPAAPAAPGFDEQSDVPPPPCPPGFDDIPGAPAPPSLPGPGNQGFGKPKVDHLEPAQRPDKNYKRLTLYGDDVLKREQIAKSLWEEEIDKNTYAPFPPDMDELHQNMPPDIGLLSIFEAPIKENVVTIVTPVEDVVELKFRGLDDADVMKFNVRLRDHHLASRLTDPSLIGKGLLSMDTELLKEGALLKLQELFVVNKQEGQLLAGIQKVRDEVKKNPTVELDRNDQVLKSVAFIPNLAARLEACIFKAKFSTFMREELDNEMEKYETAMGKLLTSGLPGGVLLRVLLLVRQFRNFLNYDEKKPDVFGVRLRSLSKLTSLKTADAIPRTILDVVCDKLTPQQQAKLVDDLTPVCEIAQDEKFPDFRARRKKALDQLTQLKNRAVSGGLKPGDRFVEVWDEWATNAQQQLESSGIIHRIEQIQDQISEVCKQYKEDPSTLGEALKSVSEFVQQVRKHMKASITAAAAPQPKVEEKKEDEKKTWKKFELLVATEGTNPLAASIKRKFISLRTIRDNWQFVRMEFLNRRMPEKQKMPFNGVQAAVATLKSLYDMEHPRWNKIKDRVEVGMVKSTADCGNTSVSMGLAAQFFRMHPDVLLVGFLNGGTDGLKLQFYGQQTSGENDKRIVVLAEVKNHALKFSSVKMSNFVPKKEAVSLDDTIASLAEEMRQAPWKNDNIKAQLATRLGVDVDLNIPVYAFVTGTIRNHWESQAKNIQEEMDEIMRTIFKGNSDEYCALPWSACFGGSKHSSFFIPQAAEGECEFVACTTVYEQIGKFAPEGGRGARPYCVASFGIGAGSCQWVTRRPRGRSELHTISLNQGMNQAGLVHHLSDKIVGNYEDPQTSSMFDDFLSVMESQDRPVIALKSGCLIVFSECDPQQEFINQITKVSGTEVAIRVFYQREGESTRVASSLFLDRAWLGKEAKDLEISRSALFSRICADAAKALGLQQFFRIDCRGKDGLSKILENDSTIIVATADASWFTELPEIKSPWRVFTEEDDWGDEEVRVHVPGTK